ncbi:c2h2 finger domain containing [Fusarium longipes]|uniref:C2h2 finger domain containing n=1 Tax=Fusarium longipes TaxID=694270 RepID=A0A395T0K2_9HYPO|nr:c2h2 finger domain containing [Fusarium longipes]
MSSYYSTPTSSLLSLDGMSLSSVEDHADYTKSKPRQVQSFHWKDCIISNSHFSLFHPDPFHLDIKRDLEHSTASSNISASWGDAFAKDPDAEELQCLFCPYVSKSLQENLAHMEQEHSFAIPDSSHLCVGPVDLIKYFRHTNPKHYSLLNLQGTMLSLGDFAPLPPTAPKSTNQRDPRRRRSTSPVRGVSKIRRDFRRYIRESGSPTAFPRSSSVIRDEVGSEFLFNTMLKVSENKLKHLK